MANVVPTVDYTTRDYSAILSDMTNLIPIFSPQWTNRDPADFGMTLLELFAYMGDILHYYIDKSANEALITSATQRQTVLQIASLIGYKPTNSTASTVTLTFQNSTSSPIPLPALTQVATSLVSNKTTTQVVFETKSSVVVPAKSGATNGSVTVQATQGQTVTDEIIGVSDGTPNQTYPLSKTSVINNTVNVTINGVSYQSVQYLIDSNNYDPVFTTTTDSDNITYVTFGDSISGRIPPNGAQIYATYRVGGGTIGNVASNTIKYVIKVPGTTIPAGLTVSNQDISVSGDGAASGGADPESTDSIRINAPQSIRAINRAVSLSDYAYLAVQISDTANAGVAKAIATADVYTSVTLYVVPNGDPGVASDNTTPTTVFNNLAPKVIAALTDKAPANTTLSVQPPTYVGAYLVLNITVSPKYNQASVVKNVTSAINNLFYIDNVVFHDTISVSDVYSTLSSVEGISNKQIQKMVRADQDQTFTITNKVLTGNVATLTTSVTHNLSVGQTASITGVDSTFNGTFVITAVTTNTFSYALVSINVSSTSASGSVTVLTVNDIVCNLNEIPTLYALGQTASPSSTGIGSLTVNASGGVYN
jgi:Baseplate J-like protein